ncbi:hypothetical protein JEM67_26700 [Serratia sp. PAMC26656]|uniref:hypothetical protein n=1 Tax=Serratia sp. PAMC26656 TaxID=2775909 RepID=UPI0018F5AAB1|nr:hypothetical protein [Serratia sp. PAMC26656]MBJ7892650.1 hypothetical protein [Serratia sp. PAMC26656]
MANSRFMAKPVVRKEENIGKVYHSRAAAGGAKKTRHPEAARDLVNKAKGG